MSIDFQSTTIPGYDMPPDQIPDFGDMEMCEKCHAAPKVRYGGRGPKPKYCEDCKGTSKGTSAPSTRVKGKNAALAAQATAALMTLNGFVALGLTLAQLHNTSGKFREEASRESFEDSVYNALLLDPELCAWICRGGIKSGKIALFIAYGLLGASVVPTAIVELREKKADRETRQAEEEEEERRNLNARPVWQT
jgi:hypothetical protein